MCLYDLESFQTIWKVSGRSKKCPDHPENKAGLSKFLQNHRLCAFVGNLKIDAIYVLYPESFCDKNLAIRKVFAFCDSDCDHPNSNHFNGSIVVHVIVSLIVAIILTPIMLMGAL